MSHSHSTKFLLNLTDKNILIADKLTEKKQYRQRLNNFNYGKLTYTPTHFPLCGGLNEAYSIVKNGMKESRIKWLPMANYPIILVLKKTIPLPIMSTVFYGRDTRSDDTLFY